MTIASTDDRLTLASASECGSAEVVVCHDWRSSLAGVSATADALALARERQREQR